MYPILLYAVHLAGRATNNCCSGKNIFTQNFLGDRFLFESLLSQG